MKTIFRILLLVLVSSWSMTAQTGIVSGNLAVSTIPTNNGNGTFTIVGIFSDPKGQYFAADVESALDTAQFVFWKGNNFYLVDTAWASGSTLNLIVNDTYSTGFIPTGNAQILEITGNLGLPGVSTTGDSNAALATPPDHAALLNYIIKRIDAWASSVGGGGGGGSAGLVCGDTLTQAGHGFAVGDLLGQSPGNGPYFKARTSSVDSLPVTAVLAVVDVNTFVICEEGLFPGFTHGLPLGRDYFLQADGALDTIPDTTYQVFAFRTRSINTAYFDIPELVIVGAGGGGGGGAYNVTASNGLNDADPGVNVDVELGGSLERNTTVSAGTFSLNLSNAGGTGIELKQSGGELRIMPFFETSAERGAFLQKQNIQGQQGIVRYSTYPFPIQPPLLSGTDYVISFNSTDDATFEAIFWDFADGITFKDTIIGAQSGKIPLLGSNLGRNTEITISGNELMINGNNVNTIFRDTYTRLESIGGEAIEIRDGFIKFEGLPNYANDAAADADGTLPSGGVYTVTAEDRTLRIKP